MHEKRARFNQAVRPCDAIVIHGNDDKLVSGSLNPRRRKIRLARFIEVLKNLSGCRSIVQVMQKHMMELSMVTPKLMQKKVLAYMLI
jgi:hypothetical protein